MIAEVYKEKGREPWKYTRQVVASDGQIERKTTRHSTYTYAYKNAYDDFLDGKLDDLYLYHPWGTLKDVIKKELIDPQAYSWVSWAYETLARGDKAEAIKMLEQGLSKQKELIK